jgi:hypothetical protein
MVSGFNLDIVEWMIRQATPETTGVNFDGFEWKSDGSAIQVRVYAEDPTKVWCLVSDIELCLKKRLYHMQASCYLEGGLEPTNATNQQIPNSTPLGGTLH